MGGTVDEDAGLHFLDSCNQTYVGNILGNHIWRDVNTNGKYDYREKGVAGVEVDLWRRESYELGFGSYTGRTTTTNDFGYYEFDCLRDGQYYMVLNGVDEFTTTRPYRSPNDDINGDQNCHLAEDWHPSGAKIRGGFIDLEAGTEPWGKPRAAGNMNVTYDGALDCDDEQIDIVLVVDRSGSMSGESLLQAKKDGRDFMEFGDKPTARFGLVAFGSDADLLSELPQPTEHAQNQLHALSHSGSTRMEEGIALAVQHLQAEAIPGRFQAILVLSDGHATDEEAAANAARAATEQGIAVLAWTEGPSGDEDFMRDEIASSPEYFEASPDEKDVQEVVDSLIPSACGDPSGGNLVCPVGAVTTVDISTGRSGDGGWIPPGQADDDWKVSLNGGGQQPASVVASPPSPPWGVLDGAQWVSLEPTQGFSQPDGQGGWLTDYVYTIEFPVPDGADKTRIRFKAFSDDRIAGVLVNGANYGSRHRGGNGLKGIPYEFVLDGSSQNWVLPGQLNTLKILVEDAFGGHTGLVLEGTVSSCPSSGQVPSIPPPMEVELQVSAFIPFDNIDHPGNFLPFFQDLVFEADVPGSHQGTGRPANPATNDYRIRSTPTEISPVLPGTTRSYMTTT